MVKQTALIDFIKKNKCDGAVFFNQYNRQWWTEIKTSFGVLIVNDKAESIFITDSRYKLMAETKLSQRMKVWTISSDPQETTAKLIKKAIKELGIKKIIIEKDYLTLSNYELIKDFEHNAIQTNWLREVKTNQEIKSLQAAANIIVEVIKWVWTWIKPGISEKEVAKKISMKILELGASGNSFDPIVSAGINGANPHHEPSDYIIQDGDMVTIDLGCMLNSYASDMTRTFVVGKKCNNEEMLKIYNLVKQAQQSGLNKCYVGMLTNDVDKACRDLIDNSEYQGLFGHGTGHGVGLQVHEVPVIAPSCKVNLKENNVITIEPGIYKSNVGGVRIEDTVVITKKEPLILTNGITKELVFIDNN